MAKTKPEVTSPPIQSEAEPKITSPLASGSPPEVSAKFSPKMCIETFQRNCSVYQNAALTLVCSGAVAFLTAAYLTHGEGRMKIAEVADSLAEAVKERGVKSRAQLSSYINMAKKLALKMWQENQFGGVTALILASATPDEATTHTGAWLQGKKIPRSDQYVNSMDQLRRYLDYSVKRPKPKVESAAIEAIKLTGDVTATKEAIANAAVDVVQKYDAPTIVTMYRQGHRETIKLAVEAVNTIQTVDELQEILNAVTARMNVLRESGQIPGETIKSESGKTKATLRVN